VSCWTKYEDPRLLTQVLWFSVWNDEFQIHNFIGKKRQVYTSFKIFLYARNTRCRKTELSDFPRELLSLNFQVSHQLCSYKDVTKGSEPLSDWNWGISDRTHSSLCLLHQVWLLLFHTLTLIFLQFSKWAMCKTPRPKRRQRAMTLCYFIFPPSCFTYLFLSHGNIFHFSSLMVPCGLTLGEQEFSKALGQILNPMLMILSLSESHLRMRHHEILKQTVSSFERFWVPFSTKDTKQNSHTGDLINPL
jgi:hypothetical protein